MMQTSLLDLLKIFNAKAFYGTVWVSKLVPEVLLVIKSFWVTENEHFKIEVRPC